MSEIEERRPRPQESLHEISELLRKQRIVEALVRRQEMPRQELVQELTHRQNLAELQRKLDQMHPADVAYILEALPVDQRLIVWELVRQDRDGEILLEVSDAVREFLIAHMETAELVAATEQLDADEIADLAPDLPPEVMEDVLASLPVEEREQLRAAMSYDEDSVGALMNFDMIGVREDVTVEVVLRYLRRRDELPDHTDQLFVIDRDEVLKGLLAVNRLLVTTPDTLVAQIMHAETPRTSSPSAPSRARRRPHLPSSATISSLRRWSMAKASWSRA